MNGSESSAILWWGLGAALLFALQLGYTVALAASVSLSRVALHRMANDSSSLSFASTFRDAASDHRLAASFARHLCLLGAVLCVSGAANAAGAANPTLFGVGAGAAIGLLLVDMLLARTIATWRPRIALRAAAPLVRMAATVLWVVVRPLNVMLNRIDQINQADEDDEEQDEEVEAFIEVGEREGILEGTEGEMMRSIVDLDETKVREIMTPRTEIVALPDDATVAEARSAALEAGHSRIPVFRGSIDEVVGVLHVRDLLRAWAEGEGEDASPIRPYLREVMFVPEPLSVAELLSEMRVKSHMALVVDEYGGMAGLVTLEDLLEEIVGDIRDEHDTEEEELVTMEESGIYTIKATAHVESLEDLFGVDFGDRDFDTVGGLVVSLLGRVPQEGERVDVKGIRLEVLQADQRRIHAVRAAAAPSVDESRTG